VLRREVRAAFEARRRETDPERVKEARHAAVTALHRFLMVEATERAKAGAEPFAPE